MFFNQIWMHTKQRKNPILTNVLHSYIPWNWKQIIRKRCVPLVSRMRVFNLLDICQMDKVDSDVKYMDALDNIDIILRVLIIRNKK